MDNNIKQHQLDLRYLRMARIWAENSYCKRRQVGALIVKDKMIISDGYNGTPSGFDNVCEDADGHTFPYVLHAEANAITKVACSNNSSKGATLYVTAAPLHRMCKTYHPGRHYKSGILRTLPPCRRIGTAEASQRRMHIYGSSQRIGTSHLPKRRYEKLYKK